MENLLTPLIGEINSLELNVANVIFRLFLSVVLGMLVGAERKHKGQIAGIRTFALISMGACLAMILSIYVPQEYMGLKNGDPGRIAAQVITGIGFIGGGAIIQMKGAVRGLTTAAGIWMTAIIGMSVGVGMYFESVVATAMVLVVLVCFNWWEHFRKLGQTSKVISIKVNDIVNDIEPYRRVFDRNNVHLSTYYISYDYVANHTELNFVVLSNAYGRYMPLLSDLRDVGPTLTLTLSSQIDL